VKTFTIPIKSYGFIKECGGSIASHTRLFDMFYPAKSFKLDMKNFDTDNDQVGVTTYYDP